MEALVRGPGFSLDPGVGWLLPSCRHAAAGPHRRLSGGSRRTARKQLRQLASGWVGLEPRRLTGLVELWIFTSE